MSNNPTNNKLPASTSLVKYGHAVLVICHLIRN